MRNKCLQALDTKMIEVCMLVCVIMGVCLREGV